MAEPEYQPIIFGCLAARNRLHLWVSSDFLHEIRCQFFAAEHSNMITCRELTKNRISIQLATGHGTRASLNSSIYTHTHSSKRPYDSLKCRNERRMQSNESQHFNKTEWVSEITRHHSLVYKTTEDRILDNAAENIWISKKKSKNKFSSG